MRLVEGMTICIEPMINLRGDDVHVMPNKWTVVTNDHSLAAHYEHSIVITTGEPYLLTRWEDED